MADYNPLDIEKKWQDYWEKNKTFKVDGLAGDKKLYVLDMFPYPSGAGLHVGHPLGYIGTDVYSRFKRSNGYKVLHPMGYDAFGLPAEQHAIKTGEHPGIVTDENCDRFTAQLKRVGLSYDWDREVRTCAPDYYHWTQWIFIKLFNSWFDDEADKARPIEELPIPEDVKAKGDAAISQYQSEHRLAFQSDAMVNWCPALGTVLANEEVIDGRSERGNHEVFRKPMRQWLLRITKYSERLLQELEDLDWPENIKEQQRHWIGKRHGAEIDFKVDGHEETLTAFTTRPDTLFGVTFFVVSPEHPIVDIVTTAEQKGAVEEYCDAASKLSELDRTIENREKTGVFTGTSVINPITGEKVPLYIGDYVLMGYGTGAVMGVPAHDERDYKFAKKYEIDIRPVIAPVDNPEARKEIECGSLCWTEPGEMLPCDFDAAKEIALAGKSNEEGKKLVVEWLEGKEQGRSVINYRLKDWIFSRQRYWGEPIPVVHWEDGTITPVSEEELPLVLPSVDDYLPSEDGNPPLSKAKDWVEVVCPETGKKGRRETDIMPQWAGSCWYYLRFIDPHNSTQFCDPELEKSWMPVDLYVGGAEHAVLHLLYARFWHKVLFDLGFVSTVEPFQRLFNQGLIVSFAYKDSRGALIPVDEVEEDSNGVCKKKDTGEEVERITAKMSKSLRNVVNPDDIIDKFGTDTFRIYEMFMGPLEAMKIWDTKAISGSNRFLRKIWSAVVGEAEEGIREVVSPENEDQDVLRGRHGAIKKVTEDIDGIRYNTAIATLMEFVNSLHGKSVSKGTLEDLVVLVSPFAPHLAEELWERLGHSKSVSLQTWPTYEERYLTVDTIEIVIQVKGKKRGAVNASPDVPEEELKSLVATELQGTQYETSESTKFIVVKDKKSGAPKLVNVV